MTEGKVNGEGGGEEGKGRRFPEAGETYFDELVGICRPGDAAFWAYSSLSCGFFGKTLYPCCED